MKVPAFTDDLDEVYVDLSIEEVVAEGIDPWRVDLLHPNPKRLIKHGHRLNFLPLTDVVVIMYENPYKLRIGIKDEHREHCFFVPTDADVLCMDTLKDSGRSFSEELTECLWRFAREEFCVAYAASDMKLGDGLFEVDCDSKQLGRLPPRFTGEMLKPITSFMELPPEWNLFLTELTEFCPYIPYAAGMSRELGLVLVNVHVQDLSHADARLAAHAEFVQGRYLLNDWKFMVVARHNAEFSLENSGAYSVNYALATGANEITGYRIAFHDLALGQSRRLQRGPQSSYLTEGEDKIARKLGFKIVEPEYLQGETPSPEAQRGTTGATKDISPGKPRASLKIIGKV